MTRSPRTIVIVGAGFSGTAVAINLLRLAQRGSLKIVLIDRAGIARGVAYAQRDYPFLLNVPAGRMSASSSAPGEFLAFAQRTAPQVRADDFLPRELYGEYLDWTLRTAELAAPPHVHLERVHGRATRLERPPGAAHHDLHLSDGRRFAADEVVLALGNPPPAQLPGSDALIGSPQYVENPWSAPSHAFRAGESVLVVGTGLTMADVVLAGAQAAGGEVLVQAISRHGLIPPSQTAFGAQQGDSGEDLVGAAAHTRSLFGAVRELAESVERRGGDWREIVALVRNLTPRLWERMPLTERRRFLRHVRPLWDVHRHRLPEVTAAALRDLARDRKLAVRAGHILALARERAKVRVTWRARGDHAARALLVDRVVNCTGPDYDPRRTRDPLLRSLLDEGVAVTDPLGLGLRTGPFGALLDARGRASPNLFYVGPMLRADHWEATAVAELRVHAERLAWRLLAHTPSRSDILPGSFNSSPERAAASDHLGGRAHQDLCLRLSGPEGHRPRDPSGGDLRPARPERCR
ncbi:MAG TPA: FAD/NAD(P)-binding protein [Steroidobacteraceae bacterium]|nr:FAD/NAD(P)-binding protein [Steroidobacteraceae bacterium]